MNLSEVPIQELRMGDRVVSIQGRLGTIIDFESNRGHYRGVYDDEIVIEWDTGLKSMCPLSMLTEVKYIKKET